MRTMLCRALLGAVLCVLHSGCGTEDPKLSWNSPKVLEVKKEFEALEASFTGPSTKDNYGERATKVGDLLKKRLSHREMSRLAATCETLPVHEENWSPFERSLILEMVWVFLKSGDHDSLVTLFSNRFPSRYHFMDTEDLLVRHGEKLKDPILILAEAYSKAQVPEVRQAIAQAVRRGFKGSGIRANDDAGFVRERDAVVRAREGSLGLQSWVWVEQCCWWLYQASSLYGKRVGHNRPACRAGERQEDFFATGRSGQDPENDYELHRHEDGLDSGRRVRHGFSGR